MKRNQLKINHPIFIIFLILFIAYSPSIFGYYIYSDDALYWFKLPGFTKYMLHDFIFYIGRFLGAFILTFTGWIVSYVRDLNVIRFLALIEFSICGYIIFLLLQKYFSHSIHSILCAVIIFSLPPFQSIVSVASCAYVASSILLSLLAAVYADKIASDEILFKRMGQRQYIISLLLLFLALGTYPSGAMFYWFASAIILLTAQKESFVRFKSAAQNLFSIGFMSFLLYGTALKMIKKFCIPQVWGIYDTGQITKNYFAKLKWFIEEPLYNSLNLWNIFPKIHFAYLMIVFIFLTFFFVILRILISQNINKRRFLGYLMLNISLFITLIILSFLPNLLAAANAAWYRCCAGLTSLVFLILILALNEWLNLLPALVKRRILTCTLLFLCLWGVYKSFTNLLYYRVIPSQEELLYTKNRIDKSDITKYKKICVIRPNVEYIKHRYDEFGTPSTYAEVNVAPFLIAVFRELKMEKYLDKIMLNISSRLSMFQTSDIPPDTLVINISELYSPTGKLSYLYLANEK